MAKVKVFRQKKRVSVTKKTKLQTRKSSKQNDPPVDSKHTKARIDLVGERIVEIRKSRNVRQKVLAKKLRISEAHLRNMEKGKIYPRLPILVQIINEFDINPNYLFLENESKKTRYLVSA